MKNRTLEEKQELIRKFDLHRRRGHSVAEASQLVGFKNSTDHIRFRKQLEQANGGLVREIKSVDYNNEKIMKAENNVLRTLVVELTIDNHLLKEKLAQ